MNASREQEDPYLLLTAAESRTLAGISTLHSLINEINDKASHQHLLATQLQAAADELSSTAAFLTDVSKVIVQELQAAV